jgi:hypothetical protein
MSKTKCHSSTFVLAASLLLDLGCSGGAESSPPQLAEAPTGMGDAGEVRPAQAPVIVFDGQLPAPLRATLFDCSEDAPHLVGGFDTGQMRCKEGTRHRAAPASCPLPEFLGLPADAAAPVGRCKTDADCADGLVCDCQVSRRIDFVDGQRVEGVSYGGGACTRAYCRTDADCGAGLLCAYVSAEIDGAGCRGNLGAAFACQTPDDECSMAGDCGEHQVCESRPAGLRCANAVFACPGTP